MMKPTSDQEPDIPVGWKAFEKQFRALIAHGRESLSLLDRQGVVLFTSPATEKLLGYAPKTFVGQNAFALLHPEDLERCKDLFQQLMNDPDAFISATFRFLHQDGTWRWLEAVGTNYLADEDIRAIVVQFRDVSEQIATQEELEQRVRFSVTLNHMARIALEATELDAMLQQMVDQLAELFRADACYLTLWDEVHRVPVPAAAFGPLRETYRQFSVPTGAVNLTASVLQAEHALVIPNIYETPYLSPKLAARFPHSCVMVLSLIAGQQKLGAVILAYDHPRTFPIAEIIQAEQAVAQVALAIAKTQLIAAERKRRKEAETLREAASLLTASFDLNQILDTLLAFLHRVVPYDSACVFLRDGAELRAMAAYGHPNPEQILGQCYPLEADQLLPEIQRAQKPVILEEAAQDPRFLRWGKTSYVRCWMGVPIYARGELIGVLTLDSNQAGTYTSQEAVLAQTFADQAAIAIDNARLLEAERRRRIEAETLQEAASTLGTSLELDQVLNNLLASLQRVVPYDSACVFLREGDFVHAVAGAGLPEPELVIGKRFSLDGNLLQPIIYRTGQPLILEDAQSATGFLKWGKTSYVRGWMGIPLWVRGRIIGVLTIDSRQPGTYTWAEAYLAQSFANQAAVALENARLYTESLRHQSELASLLNTAQTVSSTLDLQQVLEQVSGSMANLLNLKWSSISIYDPKTNTLRAAVEYAAPGEYSRNYADTLYDLADFPFTAQVLRHNKPAVLRLHDPACDPAEVEVRKELAVACALLLPLNAAGKTVGLAELYTEDETRQFSAEEIKLVRALADQAAVAIANAQLFSETRQRLAELEAVNRISKALRTAQGLEDMLPTLMDETLLLLEAEAGVIRLYDPMTQRLHLKAARGWFATIPNREIAADEGIAGIVFQSGESYHVQDFSTDPHTPAQFRPQIPPQAGGLCIPLRAEQEVLGVFLLSVPASRSLSGQEIHLLETVLEIAGSAIHRAQLNAMIQHQLQRLQALRTIDSAINASLDLRLILDLLLEHVHSALEVDAACVLLAEPNTYKLQFAAGRGFLTTSFQQVILPFGVGLAGRVAAEQLPLTINDLTKGEEYARSKMAQQERFIFYTGVPLVAKGQVQGVLEVFQRSEFFAPSDWLDFLDALSAQAAIAIDSAKLFAELQRSNVEITLAYDSTLEGWGRMLEVRDKETHGHTQRVTDMTLSLARALNLPDKDLIHIRRGALLHDIGKMAIPDRILLKPGPLTEDEWITMRQHPQIAFEILAPITFLRPALDIPYCHHERFDGTGYPRQLRGLMIPLAARIFSVVDVWDALTHDRPYRPAWSEAQVREYLIENSGTHFDPKILRVFLGLLDHA
jgi:PAS domain S-box-containing protein